MNILDHPIDAARYSAKNAGLEAELSAREGLVEKRVAILSGSTIGEVQNILEVFLLAQGVRPVFYQGGYGLFYENLVFDDGSLAAFAPDFVYITPAAATSAAGLALLTVRSRPRNFWKRNTAGLKRRRKRP